jgi:hypothetical protein
MASMVAVFAHQEENTLALGWFFFEQSNRKLYGVFNGRSVIAWLQPLEVFVNGRFIVAEILDQIDVTIKLDHGDSRTELIENRGQH